jgi:cation diffusion facilitator family transporter
MTGSDASLHGDKKLRAASYSLYVNAFLIVLKVSVVYVTGSLAILAELLHSGFDLLASIFAYIGIKKAEEPADHSHPYGHEKFENLSSLAQTVLIVLTSIFVIYEAGSRIFSREHAAIESTELGIGVMVLTIVIDYYLSKYLHSASSEYGSAALEADAYHFTTDLWGAVSVIIGLLFVMLGYPVFDSIAALFVALLMLWISYHLGMKSFKVFMDTSPPVDVIKAIEEILSSIPGVESYHKLRVRQAGSKLLVDVHIQVSPKMSVEEGHYIAHEVKAGLLKKKADIKEVTVHVEPKVKSFKKKID